MTRRLPRTVRNLFALIVAGATVVAVVYPFLYRLPHDIGRVLEASAAERRSVGQLVRGLLADEFRRDAFERISEHVQEIVSTIAVASRADQMVLVDSDGVVRAASPPRLVGKPVVTIGAFRPLLERDTAGAEFPVRIGDSLYDVRDMEIPAQEHWRLIHRKDIGHRLEAALWEAGGHAAINLAIALTAGIVLLLAFNLLVGRPLMRLAGAMQAFAEDRERMPLPVEPRSELSWLAERFRAMAEDVRDAERAIAEAAERDRAVLDTAVDAFALIDERGTVLKVNAALLEMFGYTEEDLIGQNVRILMNGRDSRLHDGYLARYRETGEARLLGEGREVIARRSDGAHFPVRLSVSETVVSGRRAFAGFLHDLTEEKAAADRIHRLAYYDERTGLPNRVAFRRFLGDLAGLSRRSPGARYLVLQFVVDGYNEIVGSLGAAFGYGVIVGVAERLNGRLGPTEMLARTNSDRFGAVLGDASKFSEADLRRLVETLVGEPLTIGDVKLPVSLSVGAMVYPDHAPDPRMAFSILDGLTAGAAARGSRQIQLCSTSAVREIQSRTGLLLGMREALERGEFRLYLQPQIRLADRTLAGAEALIRWQRGDGSFVPPGRFIPVAENTDLMERITDWVLAETMRFNRAWHAKHGTHLRTGINISAREFSAPDFVDRIARRADVFDVPPQAVELEITETVLMADTAIAASRLGELRDRGFEVAIDDFGTGYSSLGQLVAMPASRLKIDRSFVSGIESANGKREVCRFVVQLAHGLDVPVIAEGVETAQEAELLRAMGCEEAQGYHFARPIAAESLLENGWPG